MNINNPKIIVIIDPKGIDMRLVKIQERLGNNISWLDKIFGRAVAQYAKDGDEKIPMVPIGNKEYFSVMPNDAQQAFSFFYPKNPAEPSESDEPYQKSAYFTQPVDLTIWCNLDKIDANDYGLGEKLKMEVFSSLQAMSFVTVLDVYSDDVKEVYSDWNLDISQRDILMHPHYAMRFSLMITFLNDC